jgi:hypothetical protein
MALTQKYNGLTQGRYWLQSPFVAVTSTTNAQQRIKTIVVSGNPRSEMTETKLSAGLYLFLLENANLAKQQSRFYFKQAFDYREKILNGLTRAGLNNSKTGISSLVCLNKKQWPSYWIEKGERDEIEARKNELDNAFGKLHSDLKEIGQTSYQVFKGRQKSKGPCRWVEIAAERIQIIE